jgi:hypothetical protein
MEDVGPTRRRTTARERPSTIASGAGPPRTCGPTSSMPCWSECPRRRSCMATRVMTALPSAAWSKPGSSAQHPAQDQPALEELLLARPLSRPQRHRAHVRTHQGLPQDRNPIRPVGSKLPCRRLSRRHRLLLDMSPEPNHLNMVQDHIALLRTHYHSRRSAHHKRHF